MDNRALQELGAGIYKQSLKPYTPRERKTALIFGLDTEYRVTPQGNKLICWQLSLDFEHWKVITTELSWESLYTVSLAVAKEAGVNVKHIRQFVYGVFFSTAECQWLDWLASTIEIFGAHHINLRKQATAFRSMYIFDIATWFPQRSLASVARTFGLTKLSYDVSNLTQDNLDDPTFIEYAWNDAYITGEILKRLRRLQLDDSGVDVLLTKTPASTAGAEFRARFINGHHGQGDCTLRRRNLWASWGGRKEVFYRGYKPKVYYYDAHSFYPNCVARMGILPLEDQWHITSDTTAWLKAQGGFGRVIFQFPEDTQYPCLPVLINDKLCFPLQGISECTVWEARVARQQGADVMLHKGYYYDFGVDWLAQYEAELVAKRKATDNTALRDIYKAKSNSIIGKLTQKRHDYSINEIAEWAVERDLPLSFATQCHGLPLKKRLSTGSLFYPEWNTLILGFARAIVAKAIIKTDALQVATDGIYTEQDCGPEMVIDGIVFTLRDCGDYVVYKPGLYRLGNVFHRQAITYTTARKILASYTPDMQVIDTYDRISSMREAIRFNYQLGFVRKQRVRVNLDSDGKRVMREDGYSLPLPGGL